MRDYSISISVVTYNSEQHIGRLLDSIVKNVQGVKYHIYVIDNGSKDRTEHIVRECDCINVTWINNQRNIGFGRAHNRALDHINSKYHICINPDVAFDYDVVTDIADYLDDHSDIGILTPKVLNMDGSLQVLPKKDPRLIYLIARRIGLPLLKKYCFEYEMLDKDQNQSFDIEFCTGCFMFMRTALYKQLGGFDERFFMYFEDADLSRRIRATARAEYNPGFQIYHHWERAGGKKLIFFAIQIISMIKYMIKWRKRIH